jgi:hypothetical protein
MSRHYLGLIKHMKTLIPTFQTNDSPAFDPKKHVYVRFRTLGSRPVELICDSTRSLDQALTEALSLRGGDPAALAALRNETAATFSFIDPAEKKFVALQPATVLRTLARPVRIERRDGSASDIPGVTLEVKGYAEFGSPL